MIQRLFLSIYDYFQSRHWQLWTLLVVIMASLCGLVSRMHYVEDISDFMPLDQEYRKAIQVYQEVAAGNRIVMMFGGKTTDNGLQTTDEEQQHITEGIERFGELLAERDTAHWITDWQPQVDYSQALDVFSFVYEHLPYYLTEADYAHADSLWQADPAFMQHQLEHDRELLGSATGSFLQPMLENDPLGIGSRLGLLLKQYQPELQYNQYNGYIFTADGRSAIVNITSPFGSSETNGNGQLVTLLDTTRTALQSEPDFRDIEISIIGSPVIAVTNARQIRHDSQLAIAVTAILILLLLLYAFRSLVPLVHIVLSTAFGFLFGLGVLSLFRDQVSVIVLGIASIILGIAVNYPLHFLCHLQHEPQPRATLSQLVKPLFIGNVTTVGAFLTLVPLDAIAVCDLGLFSAFMLIGTILFVLVFLPHIPLHRHNAAMAAYDEDAASSPEKEQVREGLLTRFVQSRFGWLIVLIITLILGIFSLGTRFDSDLNHINYMTPQERQDMERLASMQGEAQSHTVYLSVSAQTTEEALQGMEQIRDTLQTSGIPLTIRSQRNPADLLPSQSLQQHRLTLWHDFWQRHGFARGLSADFSKAAEMTGFTAEAFTPFASLLTDDLDTLQWSDYEPLTSTILTGLARDGQLVAQYSVAPDSVDCTEVTLRNAVDRQQNCAEYHVFDLASLNRRVADALSDNFNYIGFACSAIVFLFLWLSFRRLSLALVAFLPMVIGWLWILGLMDLLDIQFNIVNVILASFIFGQGDDYTIFVTEGLVSDYRSGRRVLVSYQRSIILSALIMLIGIGALILAHHPAMQSLAQVTIIGMGIVVLMALIIPPMVFRLLLKVKKLMSSRLQEASS